MPREVAPVSTPNHDRTATRRILRRLEVQHPDADTELHYTNAYELLAATILSAQCTDERVNQVTPALFARYPDPAALARATPDEHDLDPYMLRIVQELSGVHQELQGCGRPYKK